MIDRNLVEEHRRKHTAIETKRLTIRCRPTTNKDYDACKKDKHYHGHSLSSYWRIFFCYLVPSQFGSKRWVFSMTFDLWHVNDGNISYPESPTPSSKFLRCTNHAFWLSAKNAHLFINYTTASRWRLFLITTHIHQDFIFTLRFHQTKRLPVPRRQTIFNPAGRGAALRPALRGR